MKNKKKMHDISLIWGLFLVRCHNFKLFLQGLLSKQCRVFSLVENYVVNVLLDFFLTQKRSHNFFFLQIRKFFPFKQRDLPPRGFLILDWIYGLHEKRFDLWCLLMGLLFRLCVFILKKRKLGKNCTAFGHRSISVQILVWQKFIVENLFDLGVDFRDFVRVNFELFFWAWGEAHFPDDFRIGVCWQRNLFVWSWLIKVQIPVGRFGFFIFKLYVFKRNDSMRIILRIVPMIDFEWWMILVNFGHELDFFLIGVVDLLFKKPDLPLEFTPVTDFGIQNFFILLALIAIKHVGLYEFQAFLFEL